MGAWAAPTGAALVAAAVTAYLVYSRSLITRPALAAALVPLLGGPRRVALLAGVILAIGGVLASPDSVTLLAGLAAALGMRHAVRRQWAFGLRPTVAAPRADAPADDVVLAVLPDGRAAPIAWLEQARLVDADGTLLVACALARSLAAFAAPDGPVLVLRPLAVGFAIGRRDAWDGATGAALDGQPPLARVDLEVSTAASWRQTHPDGVLLGPPRGSLPFLRRERVVRLPGSGAGAPRAMDVLTIGDPPRRYLARWAADLSRTAP